MTASDVYPAPWANILSYPAPKRAAKECSTVLHELDSNIEQILSFLTLRQIMPLCQVSKFFRARLETAVVSVDLRDVDNLQVTQHGLPFLMGLKHVQSLQFHPEVSFGSEDWEDEDTLDSDFGNRVLWWNLRMGSLLHNYAPGLKELRVGRRGFQSLMPVLAAQFPNLESLSLYDESGSEDYGNPAGPGALAPFKAELLGRWAGGGGLDPSRLRRLDLRELRAGAARALLAALAGARRPPGRRLEVLTLGLNQFALAGLAGEGRGGRGGGGGPSRRAGLLGELARLLEVLVRAPPLEVAREGGGGGGLREVNLAQLDLRGEVGEGAAGVGAAEDEAVARVFEALGQAAAGSGLGGVVDLALYDCRMGPTARAHLLRLLVQRMPHLRKLQLSSVSFLQAEEEEEEEGEVKEEEVANQPGSLGAVPWGRYEELRLGNMFQRCPSAFAGFCMKLGPVLRSLHLDYNQLRCPQASTLATAMRALPSLATLVLDHNSIGDRGLGALAAAARALPRLRIVSLLANLYGAGGARALLAARPPASAAARFALDARAAARAVEQARGGGEEAAAAAGRLELEVPPPEVLDFVPLHPQMYMEEAPHALVRALPPRPLPPPGGGGSGGSEGNVAPPGGEGGGGGGGDAFPADREGGGGGGGDAFPADQEGMGGGGTLLLGRVLVQFKVQMVESSQSTTGSL